MALSSFEMDQLVTNAVTEIEDILADLSSVDRKWFLKEMRGALRA